MMYDKDELLRLFQWHSPYGAKQMMKPTQYHISTEELVFGYDGKTETLKNVTLMVFNDDEDKVYFNDSQAYELDKMDGHFMFSTEPSELLHPMVVAFYKMKPVIETFGGTV